MHIITNNLDIINIHGGPINRHLLGDKRLLARGGVVKGGRVSCEVC